MIVKMEFDCKLAHRDEVRKVSGFSSIKELYDKISQVFDVSADEILFCTLNTHDFRDTDSLLGNYLSLGDMIVVHLCGLSKKLILKKTLDYLGLTITDNGNGRAFIKKVKSMDGIIEKSVKPGAHIAAINSESTVGMRHFEVAKMIRLLPQNTNFTLLLIEPLYSGKYYSETDHQDKEARVQDSENGQISKSMIKFNESLEKKIQLQFRRSPADESDYNNQDSLYDDLVNSSLPIDRLLSKGSKATHIDDEASNENGHDSYIHTIEKINSILESFLGINDNILAIQIYRLARENKDSLVKFANAIENSELSVFNFDEDIETYLWNCATGAHVV